MLRPCRALARRDRSLFGDRVRAQARLGAWLVAGALSGPLFAPALASAQEGSPDSKVTAEDAALAETLFRDGRALLEAGRVDEACTMLEGSHRLDPKIGTLLNLAACHERQGRTASAWAEFLEAERLARVSKVRDPKALEHVARERAEALAGRIHRIVLREADALPASAELLVGGRPIPRSAWSTPIPVDPGEHEIVARAPGYVPSAQKVFIGVASPAHGEPTPEHVPIDGEPTVHPVTIPALVLAPNPLPEQAVETAPPEPLSARLSSVPFLVGAGLFVVGTGVGSMFGLQAIEKKKERDRQCDELGCSKLGLSLQDEAGTAALVSTVAFSAAGAGALFAVYWLVRPEAPRAAPSVQLTGGCLAHGCGANVLGAF